MLFRSLEVRLVWDRAAQHYTWHLVVEDGSKPTPPPPQDHPAAVDLAHAMRNEMKRAGVTICGWQEGCAILSLSAEPWFC